ncbi:50S ribosomal protein L25 [Clostridium brassicae]|uniref:Large ribosomal subunit protein bL25 n=1 Tax=Clostridium brassicae TaxID=2999072 RepID=A0ABT4DH28_9CLOT|nr:50S ribosomal protein L25 [Clostridium brassicae]MCY6960406.1 50S ribosomal protein L25 [Clostridium brassicae]
MSQITIDTIQRTVSENNKILRKNGQVPCIMYGEFLENSIPIKIKSSELIKLLRDNSKGSIIKLSVNDTIKNCVVKNVQKDSVTGELLHVDFQCVNENEIIKMKIPVNYSGLNNLQLNRLVLDTFLSEIEMQGNVEKIPESIKIDVSQMNFDDKIFAKDIELPEEIKLITEPDTLLAVVNGFNQGEEN